MPEFVPEFEPVAAMRRRLDEASPGGRVNQTELAAKTRLKRPKINKILSGEAMGRTVDRLKDLRKIERALRLRRGELLRVMGFVRETRTARDVILGDPALTPQAREALLVLYEHYMRSTAESESSSGRSRAARRGPPPPITPVGKQGIKDHVERHRPIDEWLHADDLDDDDPDDPYKDLDDLDPPT